MREHSEGTQRAREQSDFIIPSEPKILRLVVGLNVNPGSGQNVTTNIKVLTSGQRKNVFPSW